MHLLQLCKGWLGSIGERYHGKGDVWGQIIDDVLLSLNFRLQFTVLQALSSWADDMGDNVDFPLLQPTLTCPGEREAHYASLRASWTEYTGQMSSVSLTAGIKMPADHKMSSIPAPKTVLVMQVKRAGVVDQHTSGVLGPQVLLEHRQWSVPHFPEYDLLILIDAGSILSRDYMHSKVTSRPRCPPIFWGMSTALIWWRPIKMTKWYPSFGSLSTIRLLNGKVYSWTSRVQIFRKEHDHYVRSVVLDLLGSWMRTAQGDNSVNTSSNEKLETFTRLVLVQTSLKLYW